MIVNMCWFPDAEMFRSEAMFIAILSNGLSGLSIIWRVDTCIFAFSFLHNAQLLMYLEMSLFMPVQ